jgi:uncharacterized protein YwgA
MVVGDIMGDRFIAIYTLLHLLKKYKDIYQRSLDGRTRLQKMVFLLGEEQGIKLFKYTPYYYGPYSFDLRDLLDELKFYGWAVEDSDACGYYYDITDEGVSALKSLEEQLEKRIELKKEKEKIETAVDIIIKKFGRCSRKKIIDYVYDKYKDYVPKRMKLPW